VMWTVKSVVPGAQADGAADATISLIDDQTGSVLRSQPFPVDPESPPPPA
jgi:hypothetical protein